MAIRSAGSGFARDELARLVGAMAGVGRGVGGRERIGLDALAHAATRWPQRTQSNPIVTALA